MDLQLVKACLVRNAFDKLYHRITPEMVGSVTFSMLQWVSSAFKANPSVLELTPKDLSEYVKLRCAARLEDAGVKLVLQQCDKLEQVEDIPPSVLLDTLIETELVGRVGALVSKWNAGQEVEPVKELKSLIKEYDIKPKEETTAYTIEDLLDSLEREDGVVWRKLAHDTAEVPLLERYVSPLIGGFTMLLGSRTGKGKTSQVAYLATRAAKSCYEYFGADRPIIIGVNEGNFKRAVPRLYQSALGMTASEIREIRRRGDGELGRLFYEAVGVPEDYIRYVPMYGWDIYKYEEFVEETRPSMLWLDMVEHLQTPKPMEENAKLKYLWEFMRYINLQYDMIGIGTAQLSADAEDTLYPKESTISYSKTAVQAVSELTLLMGALEGEDYINHRGWGIVKSKAGVEGLPDLVHDVVHFDNERCLFQLM